MPARTALAVIASLALAGCGGGADEDPPPPSGALAEALADVGGGGENGSLGVGWAEPKLAADGANGAELIAAALGPNAGSVIENAQVLRRRLGFDPLSAQRLVSVGGSYAFGLRLDGVDGSALSRVLPGQGDRVQKSGDLTLADVGSYAVVPDPLLRAGVRGLGHSDAFGQDLTVLAISTRARAALLGQGDRLLDEPIYGAAADCLGNVVAARMVPDKLLLSSELGVNLVAVGVTPGGREVVCTIGGTAERAAGVAQSLEAALTPGAREPRTGEPMSDIVVGADVETTTYDGVEVARAELTLAPKQPPGYVFTAISRGSLADMIVGG